MGLSLTDACGPKGEFKETRHQVSLTNAFEISVTEATQGQFVGALGFNPVKKAQYLDCGQNCPVENTTWYEAVAYCNALSREKNLAQCYTCTWQGTTVSCEERQPYQGQGIYNCPGYRLPTEAEWEYACRAGTTTSLYKGEIVKCESFDQVAHAIAWFDANSGKRLQLTKTKEPNDWGIYDMSGSVWEWIHDYYQEDLGSAAVTNPVSPENPLGRMMRGGTIKTAARHVRSSSRYNYTVPDNRITLQGFRCVRTVK
jgi:formylglycine-generating enzyme required for sulfatase activity